MFCFFFFKQKTAYEMRISDWSSDVCSSDLSRLRKVDGPHPTATREQAPKSRCPSPEGEGVILSSGGPRPRRRRVRRIVGIALEIGRASCRERVCQYV